MRRSDVLFVPIVLVLVAACTPPPSKSAWAEELAHWSTCVGSPTCVVTNTPQFQNAISDDGRIVLAVGAEPESGLVLIGLEDRWVRQVLPPSVTQVADMSGDATLDVVAAVSTTVASLPDPDGSGPGGQDLDVYFYDRSAKHLWRPAQPAGSVQLVRVSSDGTTAVAVVDDDPSGCDIAGHPSVVAFDVDADTYQDVGSGFTADVSGDGDVVAWSTGSYADRRGGDIVVHDLTTGDEVSFGETKATAPRLSADGTRVAYWIDTQPPDPNFQPYTRGTSVAVRDVGSPTRTVVWNGLAPDHADHLPTCEGTVLHLAIGDDGSRVLALRQVDGGSSLSLNEVVDVSASGDAVSQVAVGLLQSLNAVSHNGNHVLTLGYPSQLVTHWKRTS